MNATVYIETSVISYLTARPSNDLRAMANQNTTAEWWEARRPNYGALIMWQDPIVAETRALRDEYARQFNYNIDDMFEDLMTKQAAHPERVVSLQPRNPTFSKGATNETQKPDRLLELR